MSRALGDLLNWTEADQDSAKIDGLVARLADEDGRADASDDWPAALWKLIVRCGRHALVASCRVWRQLLLAPVAGTAIRPARDRKSHRGFRPFAARCRHSPARRCQRQPHGRALARRNRGRPRLCNCRYLTPDDVASTRCPARDGRPDASRIVPGRRGSSLGHGCTASPASGHRRRSGRSNARSSSPCRQIDRASSFALRLPWRRFKPRARRK